MLGHDRLGLVVAPVSVARLDVLSEGVARPPLLEAIGDFVDPAHHARVQNSMHSVSASR